MGGPVALSGVDRDDGAKAGTDDPATPAETL